MAEDFIDPRVAALCRECAGLAHDFHGLSAGQGLQHLVRGRGAGDQRTWIAFLQQHQVDHAGGTDRFAVQPPVGLEGRQRLQQGAPAEIVDRVLFARLGLRLAFAAGDVEQADRPVRALDEGAELQEVVTLAAAKRAHRHAAERGRAPLHPFQQVADPVVVQARPGLAAHLQPGGVEVLVHFRGDRHALGACAFARVVQAVVHRGGILRRQQQVAQHAVRIDAPVSIAHHVGQAQRVGGASPWRGFALARIVALGQQGDAQGHVDQARGVFGALHVARGPVQVTGSPTQHQPAPPSDSSTQVSLVPPPCEEFTTSEPSRSATRVSPPGTTRMPWPLRM